VRFFLIKKCILVNQLLTVEQILIYTFVFISITLISLFFKSKRIKKLDNESKLKLVEIEQGVKKIYLSCVLIIIAVCLLVYYLGFQEIYVLFGIALLSLVIIIYIISNRKLRKSGISEEYIKLSKIHRLIHLSILVITFLSFYFYNFTNIFGKTSYDYQIEADEQLKLKNNSKALDLLNKAIHLDSNDATSFYNRGCCKYYLGDTMGACEDWRKSKSLGDKRASENLNIYCK